MTASRGQNTIKKYQVTVFPLHCKLKHETLGNDRVVNCWQTFCTESTKLFLESGDNWAAESEH